MLLLISSLDLPSFPPLSSSPLSLALSGSLYRLLLELLELLFDKFKAVAQAHSVVLAQMQQIAVQNPRRAHEEGIKLYEQADVSAKIQTVLQVRYEQRVLSIFVSIETLDIKSKRSFKQQQLYRLYKNQM